MCVCTGILPRKYCVFKLHLELNYRILTPCEIKMKLAKASNVYKTYLDMQF